MLFESKQPANGAENRNKQDNGLLPVDTFSSGKALLFHALSNHQTGQTIGHSCTIKSTVKTYYDIIV
jgi:hypothetical protein